MATPADIAEPANKQSLEPKPKWWRTRRAKWVGLVILLLAILGVLYWYFYIHPYVSTDDARIAATTVQVANQGVGGQVTVLNVDVGYRVKKGQVLLELDHRDADARLQKAAAQRATTERNSVRAEQLLRNNVIPFTKYDEARVQAAAADAEYKLAKVAVERTYLISPIDGVVVRKLTEVGDILEAGQTAVTVADMEHAWVAANVEETSIGLVKVGLPTSISVDAGGELQGKVMEITRATAGQFALIPAENPQGNFIKLVQRIPIKVAIDSTPSQPLRVGESVEIKIRVR